MVTNNKLMPESIDTIVNDFANRDDIQYLSRLVDYDEIKDHNYNLSVTTYVEQENKREKVDIKKLNAEIKEIVAKEQELRDAIDRIIEEIEE